jgi:hypothetical protein
MAYATLCVAMHLQNWSLAADADWPVGLSIIIGGQINGSHLPAGGWLSTPILTEAVSAATRHTAAIT